MKCPKCDNEMETKLYGPKISVERCTHCFGLFVTPEVLTQMRGEWMAEAFLDIGHPKLGKEYNKIDDIQCPECQVSMDKIVDPVQTHIWMEACPNCQRIFLDAGEFSDLKYETLSDKFWDLVKGRRKAD
jgi:Zn-finger nucleic acid-binding protein